MILFKLLVYFVMVYGLSNMIAFTSGPFHIFSKIREYVYHNHKTVYELLTCMICLPTNIGFFFSLINILFFSNTLFTPYNILFSGELPWFAIVFFDGIVTSGVVWFIHTIQMFFETNIKEEEEGVVTTKKILND